ncbi:family transcriptional regulator [Leptolyngbya sp. Heron Island J]|uniref:diflavin flavoprotein n=1 Tax=Leptolyngbya sp. Heron Island J TaxID=1385935 RepID=UPI0003B9EE0F|nr:diflavin flavoprotein [Leptolyngbya sp. Heron Island J]ESA32056.1 family transcriptional regulator [Leptolyngbya sp. Heron Island J]
MVTLIDSHQTIATSTRLTLQTEEIAQGTMAIRCLDWDRDRFDIEFELQNGTTYNSFLICGDQVALVDTSHLKFEALYLKCLNQLTAGKTIDYLIVNHTEPDHSGLIGHLLEISPEIKIIGSKVAIQFLQNQIHRPFAYQMVKSGDCLDLGQGHLLQFLSAPNLHWPDTILTYDSGPQILYTCDVFGMHYCDDSLYDEMPQLLEADFQYYYDCLMRPNARSVLGALKRIDKLTIDLVATGHGPLLLHQHQEWIERYRTWSEAQSKAAPYVAIFYADDYGSSDRIARAIAQGLHKTGTAVELIDLGEADPHDVRELADAAAALVIGMPPQTEHNILLPTLNTILAATHNKQAVGLFETGGGQDEPIFPLRNRFAELGLTEAFPPILIKTAPSAVIDQQCEEAGTDLGQWLEKNRRQRRDKPLDSSLDQALGRISSGLYILTARKGEATSAMLASWVIQTSFQPLGLAVAIAKDRAIESLLHGEDCFVLNILEEGNYQPLMKHFLKRFPPGADRFAGITTYDANNGSPILADALAYLECRVLTRLDAGDHWIINCSTNVGRVAHPDGVTAVHHRKAGNHY